MKKDKFVEIMESFCPLDIAEDWDNCGIQVNCRNNRVNKVLVSLEITNSVIDEAIEEKVDLILTHHPLLFSGIRNIDHNKVIGNYIYRLIQEDISVYACHTNFDKLEGGNNDYIGSLLELNNIRVFEQNNGFCRKGDTPFETTLMEVIHKAAEAFNIDQKHFRYVGDPTRPIETIGWCSGAGAEFINDAFKEGCDLFITGDLKYHDAQNAKEMGICVLDAGHYGSEKIFTENMAEILKNHCEYEDIEIIQSMCNINPFE